MVFVFIRYKYYPFNKGLINSSALAVVFVVAPTEYNKRRAQNCLSDWHRHRNVVTQY